MGSLYTSTIKIAHKSTIESQELDTILDFFSYPIKVKRLLFYRAFRPGLLEAWLALTSVNYHGDL